MKFGRFLRVALTVGVFSVLVGSGCTRHSADVTVYRLRCVETGSGDHHFWLAFDVKSNAVFLQGSDTATQVTRIPSSDAVHLLSDGVSHTELVLRPDGVASVTSAEVPGTPVKAANYSADCRRE